MSYDSHFKNALQREFRRMFLQTFHTWCAKKHRYTEDWEDFKSLYLMGGEL